MIHISNKEEIVEVEIVSVEPYDEFEEKVESKHSLNISDFLTKMINVGFFIKDAKNVIDPNLDYVVKFPDELLKKMSEHDVQFLRDKATGDILPTLYDYTDKGFGGQIRLELKGTPSGQDIANLGNTFNNLAEQERYNNLIDEVKRIQQSVQRIERGQDTDRFAKINAGKKLLLQAMSIENDESLKRDLILQAIAKLVEGREQIEMVLIDRLNGVPQVPQKLIPRIWKVISDSEFLEKSRTDYYDIQEYFEYYFKSIQPLAYGYTELGQPQMIEKVVQDCKNVFEHKNLAILCNIEPLLLENGFNGVWYKKSEELKNDLIESYKDKHYITVSGEELLEVMEDE